MSEYMIIMRNQRSNLPKKRRRESKRKREEVAYSESKSGHASLRKDERGGVIAPKYQNLVDMSENAVFIDESHEY